MYFKCIYKIPYDLHIFMHLVCIFNYAYSIAYLMHIFAYTMHTKCHKFALGFCHKTLYPICIFPVEHFFGRVDWAFCRIKKFTRKKRSNFRVPLVYTGFILDILAIQLRKFNQARIKVRVLRQIVMGLLLCLWQEQG